jgi:F-type H+-transporting ATPase subunit b
MTYLAQSQNPLVPNLTESIIGLIAFLIVFGVLAKLIMPRVSTTLAERTNAIEGGLERAKEAQDEANALLAQYRAQLEDARHEAARLREEAKEQGAQIVADMRQRGQAEFDRLVAAAESQIDAQKQQALTSLRAEVGALSVELASRIVGESLEDEARQRRTVDRFLAQLDQQSARQETAR